MSTETASPKAPIDFTNFWSADNFYFFVCLALALIVVFLFGMQKFAETSVERNEEDFTTQLLPKYLATPQEYSRALMFYLGTLVALVGLLSILGPRVIGVEMAKNTPPESLPLFFALILVGLTPEMPWLQDLERALRRFSHERAFIPTAARAIAEKLTTAEFDFSSYQATAVLRSSMMRGVEAADFGQPRDSIEYNWARLSCLLHELRRRQDAGLTEALDDDLLQKYAKDLESIALKRRSFEDDVAQYRREKLANPYHTNDELKKTLRKTLRQLNILIGCAVRLRLSPTGDINAVLKPFGFILPPSSCSESNQNLMIVGLAVMAVCVFVTVFLAVAVSTMLGGGDWKPSSNFPSTAFDPFNLAASVLLPHGTAIFVAEWIRARRIRQGRWFMGSGAGRRSVSANYVRLALGCALAGYLSLYLWGLFFGPPTWAFAISIAAYSLLPAATGWFYAYHLDNAELEKRPSRVSEISSQALVTAFCWLVASHAWLAIGGSSPLQGLDFLLLSALLGALVGGSLAWYIPEAAANDRADPLTDARTSRIEALRRAAAERLGDGVGAGWLQDAHPALDYKSPIEAAANVDGYEKALCLLQKPQPVAA